MVGKQYVTINELCDFLRVEKSHKNKNGLGHILNANKEILGITRRIIGVGQKTIRVYFVGDVQ